MSSFCARSPNVTARRALAHDIALPFYYYYSVTVYSIHTVQYPTGKNKKEGTDTLTLVNVFILYTHCHKYRIYFYPEVPTTKSQGWVPTSPPPHKPTIYTKHTSASTTILYSTVRVLLHYIHCYRTQFIQFVYRYRYR